MHLVKCTICICWGKRANRYTMESSKAESSIHCLKKSIHKKKINPASVLRLLSFWMFCQIEVPETNVTYECVHINYGYYIISLSASAAYWLFWVEQYLFSENLFCTQGCFCGLMCLVLDSWMTNSNLIHFMKW